MTATGSEIDRIDPPPEELKLRSGSIVYVERLRTRQMFALLRIISRGGAAILPQLELSTDMDEQEFMAKLLGVVMFSVPEAENEAVEFIRTMVRPRDESSIVIPEGSFKLDGSGNPTTEPILDAQQRLSVELSNPELDDTVSVIEVVIQREASDLKALGKRLQQMWTLATKTGQVPSAPKKRAKKASSGDTQEPST